MRIMKALLSLAVCVTTALAVISPAYAEKPYTYIIVKYSQGIKMDDSDQFTLTYEAKGQTGDATISVRPSTLGNNYGLVNLPAGNYLITKIEYSGGSQDIEAQGYSCVSSFSVSANGGANIEIAAGKAETQKLIKAHPDGISVPGKVQDTEVQSTDTPDSLEDTSDQEKEKKSDEKSQNETENKTKKKKAEPSAFRETATSSLLSLIPLVFIFFGGLGVMFIMHKRGKL